MQCFAWITQILKNTKTITKQHKQKPPTTNVLTPSNNKEPEQRIVRADARVHYE